MARSAKRLGDAVYKVEYWHWNVPEFVYTEGPYSSKSAAKGRLTLRTSEGIYVGRVLELSGEWKEVEPNGN